MKFMGSKRTMLMNGLGETITTKIRKARRFVDLFTGSGSVAHFVATRWPVPVIASDLQFFSVCLADAVVARTEDSSMDEILGNVMLRARRYVKKHPSLTHSEELQRKLFQSRGIVKICHDARKLCEDMGTEPIQSAYGGYYFSPFQALWLDAIRHSLPKESSLNRLALAALIETASQCAAAPGHTAQPFSPTKSASPFLREAWRRDVESTFISKYCRYSKMLAQAKGWAKQSSALDIASTLDEGDLVFIDPPYSAVHYSRFYHVLETLALGKRVEVSGTGRYPPQDQRPRSAFSVSSESSEAMSQLLSTLSKKGVNCILTFPAGEASNGLSGNKVCEIASRYFKIDTSLSKGRFSTLGGNSINRGARSNSHELILSLGS